MSWTGVGGATQYGVFRCTAAAADCSKAINYTNISGSLSSTATSYVDGAIAGATRYSYTVVAGTAAAYGVVVGVMKMDFVFLWPQALVAVAGALVLTVLLGLAGTWRILGQKPASHLRNM